MLRFLADLQSVRDGNFVVASLNYASGPVMFGHGISGPTVLVEDGEGQSCLAEVTGLRGTLVDLRLHLATWRSEDSSVPGVFSGEPVNQYYFNHNEVSNTAALAQELVLSC